MIPKKIHYCWFGRGEKPKLAQKCIASWKKYCPDYEIIEWNENNFDVNMNGYTKWCYENKKYAFLSDYVRLLAVYKNGGLYFDTDVELIRNTDFLLNDQAFFGFETDGTEVSNPKNADINSGLAYGSVASGLALKRMLDEYSITKLSQILLDGLDLLLSNIFVSGLMTGNVSIAKTIPGLFTSFIALLSDSFYPEFLENYSKNRKEELLINIKQSINILSMISGICLSLLLIYAKDFYLLWLPDNNADMLRNLTILGSGTVMVSSCIYSLFSIFSLTNKVRINSIPESWMLLVLNGIIDVGIGSIITLLIMFNKEQRTRFLKKVLKRK